MIAIFGLPGLSQHTHHHVGSVNQGRAWLDAHLAEIGETQESLNNRRQSRVISDREAGTIRYESCARVYPCCSPSIRERLECEPCED